ncbi:MAG: thioredoxin domain-containing protein, partial [Pseudonocardiaceae bacterium]
YMEATVAMTGHGGWPMTCFLTPTGEPFLCGTYYPPSPRHGLPGFPQLLSAVRQSWVNRGDEVREAAKRVVGQLTERAAPLTESAVDDRVLAAAVDKLAEEFDQQHAGFGGAPKFPPSMLLEFLLRQHERTGSAPALSMAQNTCEAMARGGMYDQLAGGFARYCVDAAWVVPHFEKMLYDNALLLRTYTHLARLTGSAIARRVAEQTATFLLDGLGTPQGGFAASLDADTGGHEGATYVWTPAQLTEVLGGDEGQWAAKLLAVTPAGTFEHGTSVLQLPVDPDEPDRWDQVRTALLAARVARPQPARDDKVVTEWNGMAITTLAEAGGVLDRPEWVAAACAAAELMLGTHLVDGRLRRSSRDGAVGQAAGVLVDYAWLVEGLLALHQVTGENRWLQAAIPLLDQAQKNFADPEHAGAWFDTAADAEALFRRPANFTDNATPAGASALAGALATASALTGSEPYREAAQAAVARAGLVPARAPQAAGHWLTTAEALAHGPMQIAVIGPAGDPARAALEAKARWAAPGGAVVLAGEPGADHHPMLAGRGLVAGVAAAYVCHGFVCDRPVTSPEDLHAQLHPGFIAD